MDLIESFHAAMESDADQSMKATAEAEQNLKRVCHDERLQYVKGCWEGSNEGMLMVAA